ncbi:MAG: hypothetical protein O3B95_09780, partial [Chloroflexi bacterium]|nr:hypothetical protein [Chloroflexota bacterium]
IAEREGNANGPETGDLDAIIAFGMLHVFDQKRGIGAGAAHQVAIKLGLVQKAQLAESGRTWLDDESVSSLRYLADTVAQGEPYDERKAGRIAQLPFWKVVALTVGLRALTAMADWDSISDADKRVRAKAVRDAVELDDWNRYAELAGLDYQPIRNSGD